MTVEIVQSIREENRVSRRKAKEREKWNDWNRYQDWAKGREKLSRKLGYDEDKED